MDKTNITIQYVTRYKQKTQQTKQRTNEPRTRKSTQRTWTYLTIIKTSRKNIRKKIQQTRGRILKIEERRIWSRPIRINEKILHSTLWLEEIPTNKQDIDIEYEIQMGKYRKYKLLEV